MEALDKKYIKQLDEIAEAIQNSEELAIYVDEEEDEQYNALRVKYEPHIQAVYEELAESAPLQIVALEKKLLEEKFEGLYLSRILGYAVLRGEVNDNMKYIRPQDHFKDILVTICNSNNFDVLKNRVGQAVQLGFALSSDIWSTNIMNTLTNKRVTYFLESQKLEKYRDVRTRRTSNVKFAKQFESLNYYTAEFPETVSKLIMLAPSLKSFLFYRAENKMDNSSLLPHIKQLLEAKDLYGQKEFIEIILLIGLYYDLPKELQATFKKTLNEVRKAQSNFDEVFFTILEEMQESVHVISAEHQKRFSDLVDKTKQDELSKYIKTANITTSMKDFLSKIEFLEMQFLRILEECLERLYLRNIRSTLNLTRQ